MILIGLTGPIGHGKTSFAAALQKTEPNSLHLESSMVITELANAWQATLETPFDPYDINALNDWLRKLPPLVENMLHVPCSYDQVVLNPTAVDEHPVEYQKLMLHAENLRRNFTLAHEQIGPDNKELFRPLLQWLGGYLVAHVDSGIWFNELLRRAEAAKTEGSKLCVIGGLRYPSDEKNVRAAGGIVAKLYRPGHLQNDVLDPTERERENIQPDTTIMSTGGLDDLYALAPTFLSDLRAGTLKQMYQTS